MNKTREDKTILKSSRSGFRALSHLPNFITSLNLFSGTLAVYFAFQANYEAVLGMILLSAVFDFFDGFAARMLKAYSPMGKELDSLADMVSFGLAPATVAFSLLYGSELPHWLAFGGFVLAVFSALRLAKFNIDERQTTSFIGMPTPANAIFWTGLGYSFSTFMTQNSWLVLLLVVIMSGLLVAEIPMFSLKFKNLKWSGNQIQFVFLGFSVLMLVIFRLNAFAPIIAGYILISVISAVLSKNHD